MKQKRSDFKLKKVSYINGVLSYKACINESIGEAVNEKTLNSKETKFPHPDLLRPFQYYIAENGDFLNGAFIEYAHAVLGYNEIFSIKKGLGGNDQSKFDDLANVFEQHCNKRKRKFKIESVTISGQGDKAGVVIEGTREVISTGKLVRFKTPSITLEANTYGFEQDLTEELDELESEVFQYIFESKTGDKAIEFDDE